MSTNAQEVDEYDTLYDLPSTGGTGRCTPVTGVTTCNPAGTTFTIGQIVASVDQGMFTHMMGNDPRPSYFHQTNLMSQTTGTVNGEGDGLFYETLTPLLAEYKQDFASNTPIEQLTMAQIGTLLAEQAAWAANTSVSGYIQGNQVTITNSGTAAVSVPLTGTSVGSSYGDMQTGWTSVPAGISAPLASSTTWPAYTPTPAPTITSGAAAWFTAGSPGSVAVTTTGLPTPALSETGALPSGLTFFDNGNGTATLSGTPAAGTGGQYAITIAATNTTGAGTQSFTLYVYAPPAITSANAATFTVGTAGTFTVTTSTAVFPIPAISESGAPSWVSFKDNGNGTANLTGTPPAGSVGSYPITITATNTIGMPATQSFTLTVGQAPAITSAATATATVGTALSFAVTTSGTPVPHLAETGSLPSGVSLVDNGNGTATLGGTPATAGSYPITMTAANASGTVNQSFTLTVEQAQQTIAISSSTPASPAVGGTYAVTATSTSGLPVTLTIDGSSTTGACQLLGGAGSATSPATVSFTGVGTCTIDANQAGSANYSAAPQAQQSVVIAQAPQTVTITSTPPASPAVGGTYAVTATSTSGLPVTLTIDGSSTTGACSISGVNVSFTGVGTCTIDANQAGSANYSAAPQVQQSVVIAQAPQTVTITSTPPASPAVGSTYAVTATSTSGLPVTLTIDSSSTTSACSLPSGATAPATVSLTGPGSCIIDANQAGDATYQPAAQVQQSFVVGGSSPAITSAATATFTAAAAGSFTVKATGVPTPALSEQGTLPAGVTFVDNGDGTATLAGTPSSSSAGAYPITIAASNALGITDQAFTLSVDAAPAITSATSTTFTVGQSALFTVTTTGYPTPSLSESGALPSGVTFTDNRDGTAAITGTLTAASVGTFPVSITASNSTSKVVQSFTLTVISGNLVITSAASTTFTAGKAGSFTVTATGTPTPTITRTGTLPAGITFSAPTAGTATISGTPAAGDSGVYPITLTATNSAGRTSQAFTITVDRVPAITSAASLTVTAATAFSFSVTSTAYPTATLSATGLPAGVTFNDNDNGTATIAGTAAAGTSTLTLTAANAAGSATQTFTLTVKAAASSSNKVPAFTSNASDTETVGTAFTFTVTTAATTAGVTSVTRSGTLPGGVTFTNNRNGTATITGTPTSSGKFTLTFTATNTAGSATQSFVLTVNQAPAVTSAASATATVGVTASVAIKAQGYPVPSLAATGLPAGLSFTDNGNGTGVVSGTPNAGTGGVYKLTISAMNSLGASSQTFTLTVRQPAAITSASSAKATHGVAGFSFTFTSTGYPTPTLTHTGTVAGLTWTNNGNGTATLSGTPRTAGTYTLTIKATNDSGTATQAFTLTVA